MTPETREAIASILEAVVRDGLPNPRDLDVALDAIDEYTKAEVEAARREGAEQMREAAANKVRDKAVQLANAGAATLSEEWHEVSVVIRALPLPGDKKEGEA